MSDTQPVATAARSSELKLRVISAAVIAPVALALTWWGGIPFSLMLFAGALVMADEWITIVFGPAAGWAKMPLLALVGVAFAAAAFGGRVGLDHLTVVTVAVAALGLGAALAMRAARLSGQGETTTAWAPWGVFYAAVPCIALDSLRGGPLGLWVILFLFAVVWSTDIAAYFTGRALGGPKLWPAVSPKKTWSGALGGLAAAVVAGVAVAHFAGAPRLLPVAAVAAVLSVASQAGDLLESSLKRKFGVKDSGTIIPGHGGLLDRVDGLVAAAALAILIAAIHGSATRGTGGLLAW